MAARSRGCETEYDERITDLREQLRSDTPTEPSLPERRSQVPDEDIAELREAVATERGRLQAYRDVDADTTDIESNLRETARTLAERETERTAAAESRRQRREAAREYRDRLERRRQLADELANRRREARATLVEKITPRFESALDSLPGQTPPDPFDANPVTAALGILRLAQSEAPVVLEVDQFTHPAAAADYLDLPVVRC
jgi:chromosome segregation ATPase